MRRREKFYGTAVGMTQDHRFAEEIGVNHKLLAEHVTNLAGEIGFHEDPEHAANSELPIRYLARLVLPPIDMVAPDEEYRYCFDSKPSIDVVDIERDNFEWVELGRRATQRLTVLNGAEFPWPIGLRTIVDYDLSYSKRAMNRHAREVERRARQLHTDFLNYGVNWRLERRLEDNDYPKEDPSNILFPGSGTKLLYPYHFGDASAVKADGSKKRLRPIKIEDPAES